MISFSHHAKDSMRRRGATETEVEETIQNTSWVQAKQNRWEAKRDFPFNQEWNNKYYQIKQVNPVFIVEGEMVVIVTVYVFYF